MTLTWQVIFCGACTFVNIFAAFITVKGASEIMKTLERLER